MLLFIRSPAFYRQVIVAVPFGDTAMSLLSLVLMLFMDRCPRKCAHAINVSDKSNVVRHVCGFMWVCVRNNGDRMGFTLRYCRKHIRCFLDKHDYVDAC